MPLTRIAGGGRIVGGAEKEDFDTMVRKMIRGSDVVVEVIDARFPSLSRAKRYERMVLRDKSKKLLVAMNKVDLVPDDVVEEWKLILPLSKHLGKEPQLYDRTSDRRETTNVFHEYPIVAGYMLHLLHQQQNLEVKSLVPEKAVVDEELESELRALGYVD